MAFKLADVYPSLHGMSVREAYTKMKMYAELMQGNGATQDEINEGLMGFKRKLRDKMRMQNAENIYRKLVAEIGDSSYVLLVRLGEFNSPISADDYFMQNEYMEYRNSPYDCTGQHFTWRYYIFKRNGEYWAYHFISVDI